MVSDIVTPMERRILKEIQRTGKKLSYADQDCRAVHLQSAALAFIRYNASVALGKDPHDITWRDTALALKEGHHDLVMLGGLHIERGSCLSQAYGARHDAALGCMQEIMAADRAMEVANIMLEAGCSCCTDDRRLLACRCFNLFLSGCWHAGNIMEACRVKWAADRLDYKAFPYLYSGGMTPNDHRQYEDKLGSMYDIASTFSSEKGLVEVPSTWRRSLESCPKATCWYPAHIGCQDMASWMKSQSFDGFVQSELIPCGTYKAQPVFAVRHYRGTHVQLGPRYVYAVHTCRLDEKVGTMQIDCLRVLKSRKERFISGAVSGSMLYLTSLQAPILGAILCFDLTQHDKAPFWSILESLPAVERDVEHMIALEGSLYIYGGTRKTPGGDEEVLTDILVARAGNNGIVNQPWKRVLIQSKVNPERRVTPCFFGHKSPEGRLSLYLFGGMKIKPGTQNDSDEPVKDLWKLDLASGHWSEPEQHGSRPCARLIAHGAFMGPHGQMALLAGSITAQGCENFPRAFMSPDGQKALLGGGITAWGSEHFPMKRGPRDYSIVPLPDMFELDLQTMCWIVPKGRKWTSAFRTCGGGYLKSNHIALLGLTRFGAARLPGQENDWTTAINIRFQRSKAVKNILSCDRHGYERDRVVENIARTRIDLLSRPLVCQDPYLLEVLQSDLNRHDCTVLTAHLSALATHAFTPEATTTYQMLEPFSALLKGKLEVIQDLRSRLKLRFKAPWVHPDLCPFNTGPHWLGGYNEATSGVALVQAPSRKAQTGGGPWISAMYHALRSLPSPKAAVEYFRLLLPPWNADGSQDSWTKMPGANELPPDILAAMPSDVPPDFFQLPPEFSESVILAYTSGTASGKECFALYTMAVSGCLFSALLVEMQVPKVARSAARPELWPYFIGNQMTVAKFHAGIMTACLKASIGHQCSYCGQAWASKFDPKQRRPMVCACQMARYCSQDCQYRHWGVHKPVCKAARQPGGIAPDQALAFMLS